VSLQEGKQHIHKAEYQKDFLLAVYLFKKLMYNSLHIMVISLYSRALKLELYAKSLYGTVFGHYSRAMDLIE